MLRIAVTASNMAEWVRQAANAINTLLGRQGFPFGEPVSSLPSSPKVGQAVLDGSDSNRLKVWDGSAWQSAW